METIRLQDTGYITYKDVETNLDIEIYVPIDSYNIKVFDNNNNKQLTYKFNSIPINVNYGMTDIYLEQGVYVIETYHITTTVGKRALIDKYGNERFSAAETALEDTFVFITIINPNFIGYDDFLIEGINIIISNNNNIRDDSNTFGFKESDMDLSFGEEVIIIDKNNPEKRYFTNLRGRVEEIKTIVCHDKLDGVYVRITHNNIMEFEYYELKEINSIGIYNNSEECKHYGKWEEFNKNHKLETEFKTLNLKYETMVKTNEFKLNQLLEKHKMEMDKLKMNFKQSEIDFVQKLYYQNEEFEMKLIAMDDEIRRKLLLENISLERDSFNYIRKVQNDEVKFQQELLINKEKRKDLKSSRIYNESMAKLKMEESEMLASYRENENERSERVGIVKTVSSIFGL